MLLYHTLRQLSTEDADCCRFALPHRRPSGLIFLRHRFTDPTLPRGSILPLRGRGAEKQAKGRAGRRQERQAPRGICYPCPGGEDHLKRRSSSPPVPPLLGCRHCPPVNKQKPLVVQVPPGFSPRGCKGRSPLHEITLNLPLPHRGRGLGGWAEAKLKAGQAGDKEGALPCEYHSGKVNRQRRGQAPPGAWFAPFPSAARVQPRGCKGRSPLHEITLNLPLPRRGRGSGGWGRSKTKGGVSR